MWWMRPWKWTQCGLLAFLVNSMPLFKAGTYHAERLEKIGTNVSVDFGLAADQCRTIKQLLLIWLSAIWMMIITLASTIDVENLCSPRKRWAISCMIYWVMRRRHQAWCSGFCDQLLKRLYDHLRTLNQVMYRFWSWWKIRKLQM